MHEVGISVIDRRKEGRKDATEAAASCLRRIKVICSWHGEEKEEEARKMLLKEEKNTDDEGEGEALPFYFFGLPPLNVCLSRRRNANEGVTRKVLLERSPSRLGGWRCDRSFRQNQA